MKRKEINNSDNLVVSSNKQPKYDTVECTVEFIGVLDVAKCDELIEKNNKVKFNVTAGNNFTDDDLKKYQNRINLLCPNKKITDQGLSYLKSLTRLLLINSQITDTGLSYLKNLIYVHIRTQHKITGHGLLYLKNLEVLHIHKGHNNITYDMARDLMNNGVDIDLDLSLY